MTPRQRKLLGVFYAPAIRLKTSRFSYFIKKTMSYAFFRFETRRGDRKFIVDISHKIGMGAIIANAIKLIAHQEKYNLDIHIVSSSPLYCKEGDRDFLCEFFEREVDLSGYRHFSSSAVEWLLQRERSSHLAINRARDIFAIEFRPNKWLSQQINDAMKCSSDFDLSIHFRGTDKFLEAWFIDYSLMLNVINSHIQLHGDTSKVFLATDDAEFSRIVRAEFPDIRFQSFDICDVSEGEPRHFADADPFEKATEAIVNIFLLGRAPICIRTSSYLSSIAVLASSSLETRTINWTLTDDLPFPEAEIFAHEASQMRS